VWSSYWYNGYIYESDIPSGLRVYRLDDPEVVALLFGSGKLVITGGKEPADAEHAVDKITDRLDDLGLLDG
jgi:transcription initiation factor TFIID TATA-box-binding protein